MRPRAQKQEALLVSNLMNQISELPAEAKKLTAKFTQMYWNELDEGGQPESVDDFLEGIHYSRHDSDELKATKRVDTRLSKLAAQAPLSAGLLQGVESGIAKAKNLRERLTHVAKVSKEEADWVRYLTLISPAGKTEEGGLLRFSKGEEKKKAEAEVASMNEAAIQKIVEAYQELERYAKKNNLEISNLIRDYVNGLSLLEQSKIKRIILLHNGVMGKKKNKVLVEIDRAMRESPEQRKLCDEVQEFTKRIMAAFDYSSLPAVACELEQFGEYIKEKALEMKVSEADLLKEIEKLTFFEKIKLRPEVAQAMLHFKNNAFDYRGGKLQNQTSLDVGVHSFVRLVDGSNPAKKKKSDKSEQKKTVKLTGMEQVKEAQELKTYLDTDFKENKSDRLELMKLIRSLEKSAVEFDKNNQNKNASVVVGELRKNVIDYFSNEKIFKNGVSPRVELIRKCDAVIIGAKRGFLKDDRSSFTQKLEIFNLRVKATNPLRSQESRREASEKLSFLLARQGFLKTTAQLTTSIEAHNKKAKLNQSSGLKRKSK